MSTVLITGCSSGFGAATALAFARADHDVVATMRDLSKAASLERAADDAGVELRIEQLDVDDVDSVEAAVGRVAAMLGGIDVVVNNAGIEYKGPVEHIADHELRSQYETNVLGPLRVMRAVLPSMRDRGSGVIVNVTSLAGLVARPFGGIYASSKHALEALSEALHSEVSSFGVRIAVIEPGQFATQLDANTRMLASFDESSPYWESRQAFEAALPRIAAGGRPGSADQVAAAIVAVATDPDAPLRTLVGDDAELVMAVRRSNDFADYERTMREALDWWT